MTVGEGDGSNEECWQSHTHTHNSSCGLTTEGNQVFPWQGGRHTSWTDDSGNGWVIADVLLPESVCGYPHFSSCSRPFRIRGHRDFFPQLRTTVSLARACQAGRGLSSGLRMSASPTPASHPFPSPTQAIRGGTWSALVPRLLPTGQELAAGLAPSRVTITSS